MSNRDGLARLLCAAIAVCALAAGDALAQGARAAIAGTVRDGTGQPVANATISVRNRGTGAVRLTASNLDGTYSMAGLRPGEYEITVEDAAADVLPVITPLQAGERRTIDLATASRAASPAPPGAPASPPPPVVAPLPAPAPAIEASAAQRTQSPDFIPTPDRWRLEFPVWQRYPSDQEGQYPYGPRQRLNPYAQNVLKGDRPIAGDDIFMNLTAVLEMPLEYRRVPTPSGVSTENPGSDAFFGHGEQLALLPTGVFSFELFKGDTAFKPRAWALRVSPVFNVSYLKAREQNVVNATPEEGDSRLRHDVALQEAFGEVKLRDVGSRFDFVSVRAGIQPFTSDFRGFLFRDTNLGVRAFGNWGRNRNQWNVAFFDQLEKDTNSELNTFERRDQQIVVANYYRQDFLTEGYTVSPSFHANIDNGIHQVFDENGFLVRPAPIGTIRPHRIRAYYLGFGGDGHVGRLNVTHQFYQVLGHDEFNPVASRRTTLNGQFAAVEASVDVNWFRPKASVIWASGDDKPDDDTARGFDTIFDNPNVAGGPLSFWNREGIRLTQTLVGLVGPSSVVPSLRSSKTEGQANFVNPGVFMYHAGLDADLTPKLRATANISYIRFQTTASLSQLLFQSHIDKSVGIDWSAGAQFRPRLSDNIVVTGGVSLLTPGAGFKQIYSNQTLFVPFVSVTLTY